LIPRWSFFISNSPSVSCQANPASRAFHPYRPEFTTALGADLARDLAQIVAEPIFYVARLVESARYQGLDAFLGGRSPEQSDARIPPGAELDVRRQAGVNKALGLGDRPFVELGDAGRECLYECI
jgi:hypothetical protein